MSISLPGSNVDTFYDPFLGYDRPLVRESFTFNRSIARMMANDGGYGAIIVHGAVDEAFKGFIEVNNKEMIEEQEPTEDTANTTLQNTLYNSWYEVARAVKMFRENGLGIVVGYNAGETFGKTGSFEAQVPSISMPGLTQPVAAIKSDLSEPFSFRDAISTQLWAPDTLECVPLNMQPYFFKVADLGAFLYGPYVIHPTRMAFYQPTRVEHNYYGLSEIEKCYR